MTSSSDTIGPVNVVRNQKGYFRHPDFPVFGEEEYLDYRDWVEKHNLEVAIITIETSGDAVVDRYFENNNGDFSFWEPAPPETGDWFCLSINDTVNGPVCFWAMVRG